MKYTGSVHSIPATKCWLMLSRGALAEVTHSGSVFFRFRFGTVASGSCSKLFMNVDGVSFDFCWWHPEANLQVPLGIERVARRIPVNAGSDPLEKIKKDPFMHSCPRDMASVMKLLRGASCFFALQRFDKPSNRDAELWAAAPACQTDNRSRGFSFYILSHSWRCQ